jgi:hypothetical protein
LKDEVLPHDDVSHQLTSAACVPWSKKQYAARADHVLQRRGPRSLVEVGPTLADWLPVPNGADPRSDSLHARA